MKETMLDIFMQHSHGWDVAIVATMAVLITVVGFLEGLFVGFLLAMWAFTVQYSGTSQVIRAADDVKYFHSNIDRPLAQHAVIERFGHRVRVIHVEGFLMFGSSPKLVDKVRPLLASGGPEWIVLNFRGVRGLDYSAVCDLVALGRRAKSHCCRLILTELRDPVLCALARARVKLPVVDVQDPAFSPLGLAQAKHYNLALECCENALLRTAGRLETRSGEGVGILTHAFGDFADGADLQLAMRSLLTYFEQVEYQPGVTVWNAGEPATFLVGVVEGQLQCFLPSIGCDDARLMETVRPGSFIGFTGLLNHLTYVHTALVPVDGPPCVVLKLQWGGFTKLSAEQPCLVNAMLRGFLRRSAYEFRALTRLAAHV